MRSRGPSAFIPKHGTFLTSLSPPQGPRVLHLVALEAFANRNDSSIERGWKRGGCHQSHTETGRSEGDQRQFLLLTLLYFQIAWGSWQEVRILVLFTRPVFWFEEAIFGMESLK